MKGLNNFFKVREKFSYLGPEAQEKLDFDSLSDRFLSANNDFYSFTNFILSLDDYLNTFYPDYCQEIIRYIFDVLFDDFDKITTIVGSFETTDACQFFHRFLSNYSTSFKDDWFFYKVESFLEQEQKGNSQMLINVLTDFNEEIYMLEKAIDDGDLKAVKSIVENTTCGALHESRISPLCLASKKNHLSIVEFLLNRGADVDAEDGHRKTSLIYALEQENLEIIELLVDNEANINQFFSFCEKTPLTYASEKGCLSIVDLLVNKGADIHLKDMYKRTALSYPKFPTFIGIIPVAS